MVQMKIQIRKETYYEGRKEVEWEIGEVIGVDLYDAWDKAIAAGHDPQKRVIWRVY